MSNRPLPSGWKRVPLGEVAILQTGVAKGRRINGTRMQVPYLRVANVQDGHVDLDEIREIEILASELDRFRLRRGDVLFTEGGDFDKLGRGTVWNATIDPCLHQNHVFAVRPNLDRLCPEFLAFQASSSYGRRYFQKSSKQSTNLASINSTQLKQFPVLLPPLPEQRKIAAILRTWDEAIEKLDALIAQSTRRAAAFARKLFDPCHPAFEGNRASDWAGFALGSLFAERNESGSSDDRLLSITMGDGVISRDEVGRKDSSSEDKSSYKLILPGDIGYNTMRMWQGVSGLSSLRGIVSPAYTVVVPKVDRIDPRYAAHLFKSRRMVFDFQRYSQGLTSDTWNLKFPVFARIKVLLPRLAMQSRQADVLDGVAAELRTLTWKAKALDRQKRGLMQKLLTGEWRTKF